MLHSSRPILRSALCLALLAGLLPAPVSSRTAREACAPSSGKVFLTVAEALELAFPGCEVERGTIFLSKAEQATVKERAGSEPGSRIVHPYSASKDGELVGTAWFDTHKVRTKKESLMIVVDPEGKVDRIEVLAFMEPAQYLPTGRWFEQFDGRVLDKELELSRGIKNLAGATLSSRATTRAVRRALALHAVVAERDPGTLRP